MAFAVISNAKVNSTQTRNGGNVKVSARENTAISLDVKRHSGMAYVVESNAKVNSTQTCDGGGVKVSCSEIHCHIS